ncbi:MAG: hypothetical protein HOP02_10925 [Methylococcaceae bacterium]|nr:hypothetical protein [Methylococcaceae bacterium]
MIGKNHQGALVTIVDRVSKFTLIKKVDSKHAEVVTQATVTLLKPYLDKVLAITPITARSSQVTRASRNNSMRRYHA